MNKRALILRAVISRKPCTSIRSCSHISYIQNWTCFWLMKPVLQYRQRVVTFPLRKLECTLIARNREEKYTWKFRVYRFLVLSPATISGTMIFDVRSSDSIILSFTLNFLMETRRKIADCSWNRVSINEPGCTLPDYYAKLFSLLFVQLKRRVGVGDK